MTEILTAVLVAITAYYAWQTRKTVRAMEEANEASNRPIVSINLQDRVESVSFVDLCITNAGKGLARDISFEVIGDDIEINAYNVDRKQPLSNYQVLRMGMKVLAPGETRKYWILSVIGRADELRASDTTIKVKYYGNDRENNPYTDEFKLDFFELPEGRLGGDPFYSIAKEQEKIVTHLKSIADEVKKK